MPLHAEDGIARLLRVMARLRDPDAGCPWDVDGNGAVGPEDLWMVLVNLGPCAGCPEDVNGDDLVDLEDVIAVAMHFGSCG